ncbi:hypothetical protein ColTof4_04728 [Colletotrichum tofieldiae]|nr:hypothetical protein ColTof3_11029 [Colletotrichum tofieldiae]GKT72305.1 hypothetical protein ColTof4_04728 [Colletotrichum tofieldiae]GKT89876.1 hypothetical protein Ct61P_07726 [Colletotrichum tofieldiae]
MPKHAVPGEDPVPKMFWVMVGGNSLSPPPTWDRFLLMTAGRNKVEREARAETKEFKAAQKQAKEELMALKKANKKAFKGGQAAWGQRKREAETNSNGEDEDETGRENQRSEENNIGGDRAETPG